VSRTARLQAFLVQRYGSNAKLSGEWRGSWNDDGETRAMDWHVCAEQPVVSGDSWQQLLAVCGALSKARTSTRERSTSSCCAPRAMASM
jgi:hypothetical protein